MGEEIMGARSYSMKTTVDRLIYLTTDVSKILAVHETRLNEGDKRSDQVTKAIEDRRVELKENTTDLYRAIEKLETSLAAKIDGHQKESSEIIGKLVLRISSSEKYIWMAVGAIAVISWAFSFLANAHMMPWQQVTGH
jgi:hypothetical protein